ncbi:hypothetical protein SAMN06298212_1085 [Ruaniaceae bacterium KH17]|nr:hypothetical protein SAMN06298212_1085 [Ruaniaceae bacterium KH17]
MRLNSFLVRDRYMLTGVVVVGICALLVGCSDSSEPEVARVDRILSMGGDSVELSDFERKVFEDGVVSQAEYDEAFGLWAACVKERGVQVGDTGRDEFGFYWQNTITSVNDSAEEDEQMRRDVHECSQGTWIFIDNVYRDQVLNPESRDWFDGIAECLVDAGLVEKGFTREDYFDLPYPPPWGHENEEARECQINPFRVSPKQ